MGGATGYHMIKYKNLKMIDSCGFMQGSLSALVDLLMKKVDESSPDCKMEDLFPNTIACIKESRFDNAIIPLLTGKLTYPHGLIYICILYFFFISLSIFIEDRHKSSLWEDQN